LSALLGLLWDDSFAGRTAVRSERARFALVEVEATLGQSTFSTRRSGRGDRATVGWGMKSVLGGLQVLVAVAALCLVGESGSALAGSPPATFTDPSNDSGPAPDITSVTVSSPDSEQIVVTVAIANQPALATGAAVYVDLDTDQNPSTGSPSHGGADYVLHIYAQGVATFKVNRSDVGDPTGFNFYAIAQPNTSSSPNAFDLAPDYGTWSYQIAGAKVTLRVAAAVASKPRAGTSWTAKIRVLRSDTGKDLGSEGKVACAASVRGLGLKVVFAGTTTVTQSGLSRSFAVCKWRLPKTSHGKLATGRVTASYSGGATSHTFRAKVS
jgi:hypothetical protein